MEAPLTPRTRWQRLWPWLGTAPFELWGLWLLSRGEVRWEVLALMALVPALAFASPASRRLYTGLYPLGLVALLYDAMRFVKNVGLSPERVHLCDLRAVESSLFGYTDAQGRAATLHDWIQRHPTPALDALFAVPYGTFIYAVIATAVLLYFRDFVRLQRFAWAFFLLNLAGFVTYHVFPAAPPWYFHAHGCVVDLAARASEGPNLARVDAMLGTAYFHGFYGRSNDVFGAVPSLHVAYPALIALEAWPFFSRPLRALSLAYAATMVVAAVWLDHHWGVDVLLGLTYTAVITASLRRVFARAPLESP